MAPKIVEIAVIKTGAVPKFAFCFNRELDIIKLVRSVQKLIINRPIFIDQINQRSHTSRSEN